MGNDSKVLIRLKMLGAALAARETKKVTDAERALDRQSGKTGRSLGVLRRGYVSVGGALGKVTRAARYGAIALASVSGVISKQAVDRTVDLAKATAALARNFGLTEVQASRLAGVASVRGIDLKSLQMSFTALSKQQQAAVGGNKTSIKYFEQLGLTTDDLVAGQHNFQGLLFQVADGLGRLPGGAQRAALAQKLLGRGSQTLIPLMKQGSKTLKDQLALAKKYGVTLAGKPLQSALDLVAVQRELKFAQLGFQIQLATKVIPTLLKGWNFVLRLVNAYRRLSPAIKDTILVVGAALAGLAFGPIGAIVIGLAVAGVMIRKHWKEIAPIFDRVNTALHGIPVSVFNTLKAAALGVWAVIRRVGPKVAHWLGSAIPKAAGALVTGVRAVKSGVQSAIGPVVRTFNTVKDAVTGFIGGLIGQMRLGGKDVGAFGHALGNIGKALLFAGKVGVGALLVLARIWRWVFMNVMLPVIRRVLPGIVQIIQGVFRVIGGIVKVFAGVFTGDWRRAWRGVKQIFSGQLKILGGVVRAGTAPLRAAAALVGRGISGAFSGAWGLLRGAARGAFSYVRGRFDALIGFFRGMPGRITGAASGMFAGVKDAFRSAINWIIGKWNGLTFHIGGTDLGPLGHLPDINIGTPDIPMLGTGGTVRRAGAAIVGDRGPELLSLPAGAHVTSARETRRLMARREPRAMTKMLPAAPLFAHIMLKSDVGVVHEGIYRLERRGQEAR
jgi:hypothetical protein